MPETRIALDRPAKLDSIHAGHNHIREYQIDMVIGQDLKSALPASRLDDIVFPAQMSGYEIHKRHIVLNKKQSLFRIRR